MKYFHCFVLYLFLTNYCFSQTIDNNSNGFNFDFSLGAGFTHWWYKRPVFDNPNAAKISKSDNGFNIPAQFEFLYRYNRLGIGANFTYEILFIDTWNNTPKFSKFSLLSEYHFTTDFDKIRALQFKIGIFKQSDVMDPVVSNEYFADLGYIYSILHSNNYAYYIRPNYELKFYNVDGLEKKDITHLIHSFNINFGIRIKI